MKARVGLEKKLLGGVSIMLALLIVSSTFAVHENRVSHSSQDALVTVDVKKFDLAGVIGLNSVGMSAAMDQMIAAAAFSDAARVAQGYQAFDRAHGDAAHALREIGSLPMTGEGKRLVSALEARLLEWKPLIEECNRHIRSEDIGAAYEHMTARGNRLAEEMVKLGDDFLALQRGLVAQTDRANDARADRGMVFTLVLGLLCVAGGVAVVNLVLEAVHRLGGLTVELDLASDQVAGAARQIAGSSQNLARGAAEQAASLERTSESSEQVNAMTRQNAAHSQKAAGLAGDASRKVEEANRSLEHMVLSMDHIKSSSEKIGRINSVIDEIAFQTNILALNAAVEAARAGEAGLGFAVVADEVRNLAHRASQAARDTSALIDDSIATVAGGRSNLDQVAAAIRSITDSTGQVRTLVEEVSQGSQQQAAGIEQVSRAIAEMQRHTQQSASGAEESASASEHLNGQSEAMKNIVEQLTALVRGAAPAGAGSPRLR